MKKETIERKGWFQNEDGDNYYIDSHIVLGEKLAYHAIKNENGEDIDNWYIDYEHDEEIRLYDTKVECERCEDSIYEFNKAKKDSADKVRKDKLIAALKEYSDNECFDFSNILKEAGYDYCHCESFNSLERRLKYERIARNYRQGYIAFSDCSVPLDKVDHAWKKDNRVYIRTISGKEYNVVNNNDNKYLYESIIYIFNL